jgi:hypothetical protein
LTPDARPPSLERQAQHQINTSLITAQLLAALPAATLGIPAGLLLYEVAGGHLSEAPPPLLSLLAVIPVTLAAVAVISAIPIRIGARRPVADILRADYPNGQSTPNGHRRKVSVGVSRSL